MVNTSADLVDKSVPAAFVDLGSLARLAVEHLAGLGYSRLLHIGYGIIATAGERRDAFERESRRRGLVLQTYDVDEVLPLNPAGNVDFTDRVKADFSKKLKAARRPLGIIVLNDLWGAAVCDLLAELGWNIPDDAGVLAFGNSHRARTCSPPLSSVRVPYERIGFEATRMVHRLIEGERLAKRKLALPVVDLVARESTIGHRTTMPVDVDQALELIRRHACEGIRVEDVVRQLQVPMRTLKSRFARVVGHSMGDELRIARLERAKELLTSTHLSLTRIAGLIGYNGKPPTSPIFPAVTPASPRPNTAASIDRQSIRTIFKSAGDAGRWEWGFVWADQGPLLSAKNGSSAECNQNCDDAWHAKQLLEETDVPLKSIAERAGFKHVEYMSVVFKRQMGLRPGEYRANNRRKLTTSAGSPTATPA